MRISYVCLIYKSIKYLKFLYDQFNKYTKLNDGDEFYFVANDATKEVLDYLSNNNIPHYIHNNTDEQKKEWYINNVYRAYNFSAKIAKGEYIIFLNSDFAFSDNWSENLQKYMRDNICVSSRLVERGRGDGGLESGKYGIEKSFGRNTENYRDNEFNNYSKEISVNELKPGGLFMPVLIKKDYLEKVNYYPEGNIEQGCDMFNPIYTTSSEVYSGKKQCISGDIVLMKKLLTIGVEHWTAFDSIVYHFQEGEMKS
jgi:hypothetical protein